MVRLRDYTTISCSPLTELLAGVVLEQADRVVVPLLARARRNRDVLTQWAADNRDLVELSVPLGGVAAFPRFPGLRDTRPTCESLADRDGVLVVPGDCFGHPQHMRIGFGGDSDTLAEGLAVLAVRVRESVACQQGLRSGR
jgi:aspartate/methionine/tyrosine aminotransferase